MTSMKKETEEEDVKEKGKGVKETNQERVEEGQWMRGSPPVNS